MTSMTTESSSPALAGTCPSWCTISDCDGRSHAGETSVIPLRRRDWQRPASSQDAEVTVRDLDGAAIRLRTPEDVTDLDPAEAVNLARELLAAAWLADPGITIVGHKEIDLIYTTVLRAFQASLDAELDS